MLNWMAQHQLVAGTGLALVAILGFATACKTAAYQVHPGSVDAFDSQSYDTLLVAQATIQQAKQQVEAGALPAAAAGPLNHAIQAYDVAETAWQAYHAAGNGASVQKKCSGECAGGIGGGVGRVAENCSGCRERRWQMSTLQYVLSILQIALNAAQGLTTGNVKGALATAQALEQIIQSAVTAYQQHTGQAIDPSLLQGIALLPEAKAGVAAT